MAKVTDSRLEASPISGPIAPKRQDAKRHYGVHPYFTRRSWNVLQKYIEAFSRPGDVVCDPFGGSGVTAVEALVLRRKAIQVDIAPLANFIAKNVAVSPVSLRALSAAYNAVSRKCESRIARLYSLSESEVAAEPIPYWYPKDVPLPANADVRFVHELFTRRALIALSILRHAIMETADPVLRDLLLLTFSGTLAKVNRTFVSAEGRKDSRGGSTIFSVYRYHVPPKPVELNVWEQFALRFPSLLKGKTETNALIGDFYREGETFKVIQGSATALGRAVRTESVDYIYTDPPYGGHIAYLDLSTMWDAWLGFTVSTDDRKLEVIEGGDLKKSKAEYADLLGQSIREMFRILRYDRWLSIVFAHKDPAYWDNIVKSCQGAGFEYVNTAVQRVGVIWSMHKKKNPLRVLAGELVLNFRKVRNPKTIAISALGTPLVQLIKDSAELTIVRNEGATTEEIYHDLVPKLLEAGHLSEIRKDYSDVTPLLQAEFDFSEVDNRWHLRPNTKIGYFVPLHERIRFYVTDYLRKTERLETRASFDDIVFHVMPNLINGEQPTNQSILLVLQQIAHSPDGKHWVLGRADGQREIDFSESSALAKIPALPIPKSRVSHNEIIYRLAKLGLGSGLLVHVGKREQSDELEYQGERLSTLSLKAFPLPLETSAFGTKKIEQIDCTFFDTKTAPVYAFEVEASTPMTTAIERFMELLKINPDIAGRLVILAPRSRRRKLNDVLAHSHFIGHPLFMENKIRYLYYDDFIGLYEHLRKRNPSAVQLINALDKATTRPTVRGS